jgi:hypothetical protein
VGGARRWLVLVTALLLTACQSAEAAAPRAAAPSGPPAGTWTRGSGADVLDVRPGDHRADDAMILAAATTAATAVSRLWGSAWHRPPVVVAVAGTADMARLSGRAEAATDGLVAVTTLDRVYLDVPSWLALPPAGRQVLLTHEVTHLATGSAGTDLPLWLEEGFADEVALAGSGLTVRAVAAALLDPLRSGRAVPAGLPTDSAFGAGGDVAAQAYAGAWLACRLVATDAGRQALVATYRAAVAGSGTADQRVDRALRDVTGAGTATWTQRWRTALVGLVARGGPAEGVLS